MEEKKNGLLQKFANGKGNPWLIGLLIGLLLLVIALPNDSPDKAESSLTGISKKTENRTVENSNSSVSDMQDSVTDLEKRLERVLQQVEGVGEVEVMITLRSSGEKIVEKDVKNSGSESEQNQSEQGKSSANSSEQEESTVYTRGSDGAEMPYVREVMEPEVAGVIVAAQGGENSVVAANITDAVMALFGIEAHKIKVMKKV